MTPPSLWHVRMSRTVVPHAVLAPRLGKLGLDNGDGLGHSDHLGLPHTLFLGSLISVENEVIRGSAVRVCALQRCERFHVYGELQSPWRNYRTD